ncbi:MAG TPA: hypothetical protein VGG08_07100 [Solirubrobacteraceae bacterium]|jgi:hypothetical protein
MSSKKRARAAAAALICLAALIPAQAGARQARAHSAGREVNVKDLLRSHQLWATINVCNPSDKPDTVGIRGSMPADGVRKDRMFMAFRLQYLEATSNTWLDLAKAASPSWVPVGAGSSARQGGFSFMLKPMASKPAVTLRGVVDFQWRSGKTVRQSGARLTSTAHKSVTGADPAGYSAATCVIGG